MEPHKIRIQCKQDGDWKTFCIWLEKDRYGAELMLKRLKSKYEDVRIVDYEETGPYPLETAHKSNNR